MGGKDISLQTLKCQDVAHQLKTTTRQNSWQNRVLQSIIRRELPPTEGPLCLEDNLPYYACSALWIHLSTHTSSGFHFAANPLNLVSLLLPLFYLSISWHRHNNPIGCPMFSLKSYWKHPPHQLTGFPPRLDFPLNASIWHTSLCFSFETLFFPGFSSLSLLFMV